MTKKRFWFVSYHLINGVYISSVLSMNSTTTMCRTSTSTIMMIVCVCISHFTYIHIPRVKKKIRGVCACWWFNAYTKCTCWHAYLYIRSITINQVYACIYLQGLTLNETIKNSDAGVCALFSFVIARVMAFDFNGAFMLCLRMGYRLFFFFFSPIFFMLNYFLCYL